MNDDANANDHTIGNRRQSMPWPDSFSMDDFRVPESIDDMPDAFYTFEFRNADTGAVHRLTNAPSRKQRRRLERQLRNRKRRERTARKP